MRSSGRLDMKFDLKFTDFYTIGSSMKLRCLSSMAEYSQ